MASEIRLGRRFGREARRLLKKYPSLRQELGILQGQLGATPRLGTLLGNNCYKICLAVRSKGQGKSGGMRVITYVIVQLVSTAHQSDVVYLATIYDKSERENIETSELKAILKELNTNENDLN